jgi:hypothetical protein
VSVIAIESVTLDGIVSDPPGYLACLPVERVGAAVLARYARAAR